MSTPDTTVGAKQLLTTTRAVRDPATRGNFGLGIESPPNFTTSAGVHNGFTAVAAVVLLGVIFWAVRVARREHTAIPFFFLLGGALTVGYEPVVDVLGKCFLPKDYQWTLFTVLDRSMPVYAIFVYAAFFGGFAIMAWNHLNTGGSPWGLWKWYAGAILINTFLFESLAVSIFSVYTYYGHQPCNFWGFPLWWPFVNTAGPILAGARLRRQAARETSWAHPGGDLGAGGSDDRWRRQRRRRVSHLACPQFRCPAMDHVVRWCDHNRPGNSDHARRYRSARHHPRTNRWHTGGCRRLRRRV